MEKRESHVSQRFPAFFGRHLVDQWEKSVRLRQKSILGLFGQVSQLSPQSAYDFDQKGAIFFGAHMLRWYTDNFDDLEKEQKTTWSLSPI